MTDAVLNGEKVLRASVVLPRWGVWTADVELAGDHALAGAAKLEIGGLSLKGTIVHGAPYEGRSFYQIDGGKAGWRNVVKPRAYRSAAGVKRSNILIDVARDAGEALELPANDTRIGPAWEYPEDHAARTLDAIAPENWYVGEDGVTRIGVRTAKTYTKPHTLLDSRPEHNRILVSTEDLTGLLPGAKLHGLEAATIRHEITSDTMRTHIWGTVGVSLSDRFWQAIARLVLQIVRPHWYHGVYEYRVTGGGGGYLNLRPIAGFLPPLSNVPIRVGAYGARGTPQTGMGCLVGFINADPSRPFVHSFEGQWGGAAVPPLSALYGDIVELGAGGGPKCARAGDTVNAGYIVLTSTGLVSTASGTNGYFPGDDAGSTVNQGLANSAAASLVPAGSVLAMTGGKITSGSAKVKVA